MSDIDFIRATGGAGLAGSADPDSIAIEDFVDQTETEGMNYLVRSDIHGKGQRAAISAFFTLVAGRNILSAFFFDLPARNGRRNGALNGLWVYHDDLP